MIEVKGVCFTYPNGVEALKDVSLTVRDGEFVALMGQNGAGKTTLVKHFNGLLKPAKGHVSVDGIDVAKSSVAALARNVGFVFQNPDHQLFSETVEAEISFALRNFGFEEEIIKSRVTWALNVLSLTQYRETSPFMLSGGERKRVALASVLAWNPKMLILDEPTIGQDYQQKEKLRQLILQMRTQQKTIIMVTHDVEFVAECNPRILLMREGRIIADGEAGKILTNLGILEKASIVPPQVAQILIELSKRLPGLDIPEGIIDVYDARQILLRVLGRKADERV